MNAGWVQAAVNSFSEGRAARTVWVVAALVLATGWFGFFAMHQFRGLTGPESMEHAQLARNIARGRGYTTQCMRPLDVSRLKVQGVSVTDRAGVPELRVPPVYPSVLAGLFALTNADSEGVRPGLLFPAEKRVIVPLGVAVSLATAVLVLLIGSRLFDARVGRVAAVVYVLSRGVVSLAVGGGPIPFATLLFTGALYAGLVAVQQNRRGRPAWRWAAALVACGALVGLAVLTGYAMAAAAAAVLVFLYVGCIRLRGVAVGLVLVVVLLVLTPWVLRNMAVSGRPFGNAQYALLHFSRVSPGDALDRSVGNTVSNVRAAAALKAKLLTNASSVYDHHLRLLGSGLVISFFLVSLFHRGAESENDCLKWSLAAGLGVLGIAIALQGGESSTAWFHVMLPGCIVFATAFLFDLADRPELSSAGWSSIMVGGYVVLSALPGLLAAVAPPARPYPPYYPPLIAHVCERFTPAETICTDIPWATAWYGDRRSLLAPLSADDLVAFDREVLSVAGVYLAQPGDAESGPDLSAWLPRSEVPLTDGFRFTNGVAFPPGTRDQLVLTDGPRWEAQNNSEAASEEPLDD